MIHQFLYSSQRVKMERLLSADFQITQEWYYLKEVKAPEGYTLSRTVIPVKPQNGATVTVEPIRNGKDGDMAETIS